MKLLDLFKFFFNPAHLASEYLTLYGGGGKDGGGGIAVPKFKPWSIATELGGTSIDKKNKITADLSPELQDFYDMYLAGAKEAMPTSDAQLFGRNVSGFGEQLTREAMGMNTDTMASDYYNKQLALLAPGRAQEEARLADTLFSTGRTGAAIGYGDGYINPEQFTLLKAREEANAAMALSAEDRARTIRNAQLQEGLSLWGGGEQLRTLPYQTSANILGNSINLSNTLLPNIGYGIQAGSAAQQGAIAQAQMAAQQQGNSKGLLGGLASAGATFFGSPAGGAAGVGGLFSSLGTAASLGNIASTGALAVSDRRLKTNIKLIGSYKNGLNKYSWDYIWGEPGIGVMADEVEKLIPEAVVELNGYKAVNYALIGE